MKHDNLKALAYIEHTLAVMQDELGVADDMHGNDLAFEAWKAVWELSQHLILQQQQSNSTNH